MAATALYAALSLQVEDIKHRAILPTFRMRRGKAAMDKSLPSQVEDVAAEAGVRSQL